MPTIDLDRSLDSLMSVAQTRLNATNLAGSTPGKVTRLLLAAVNNVALDFYTTLKTAHAQAFLSTATGDFVDAIGAIVGCTRNDGESDDNYKFRISNQTLSAASANQTAIKLAILSTEGVVDVQMKPYTHGTGSGSVFVITQDPYPSADFLSSLQAKVDDVVAFGNKVFITAPTPVPVEIGVKLIFSKKSSGADQNTLLSQAQAALNSYITGLMPSDTIAIDQIISTIMQVSKDIMDVQFYKFLINGKPALIVDQTSKWDQRFVASTAPNALIVS